MSALGDCREILSKEFVEILLRIIVSFFEDSEGVVLANSGKRVRCLKDVQCLYTLGCNNLITSKKIAQ